MGLEGRQITDFQLKIRNPWRCKVWPNSEPIRHFSTRKPGEKPGKGGRKSKDDSVALYGSERATNHRFSIKNP